MKKEKMIDKREVDMMISGSSLIKDSIGITEKIQVIAGIEQPEGVFCSLGMAVGDTIMRQAQELQVPVDVLQNMFIESLKLYIQDRMSEKKGGN